jgi:hypothetical protein
MKHSTVPCIAATTLLAAIALAIPAKANSIAITYSFAGAPTGPPVLNGTTLTLGGLGTGSILSGNPGVDAIWNPVTFQDHSVVDLTTGLLNGTFSLVFADGATLLGNIFENVSAVDANGVGPYTQTLTFTSGTREFTGATGLVSGSGIGGTTGYMVSGSGIVNAPAVPEPASAALFLGGLALISIRWCRPTAKCASESRPHL